MTLFFSVTSLPRPNILISEEEEDTETTTTSQEFITEFKSSESPTDPNPRKFTIPPIQNQWNNRPVQTLGFVNSISCVLNSLPEHAGFEEFEDVPVGDFGAALLAGYGWHEGRGIGKNPKGDVEVVQFKRRTGKEGLGFVKECDFMIGDSVRIIKGANIGCIAEIVVVLNSDLLGLKLSGCETYVRVSSCDIEECELRDLEGENKIFNPVSWLTSHIRVRIMSKDLKGGKYYLKKGKIVDVVGPKICDVVMDGSGELVQGVDQELLETALPSSDGLGLVLYGEHKGVFGNLVEKDIDNEIGVVRDADSHALITVKFEQIAEYVGDPSLNGY